MAQSNPVEDILIIIDTYEDYLMDKNYQGLDDFFREQSSILEAIKSELHRFSQTQSIEPNRIIDVLDNLRELHVSLNYHESENERSMLTINKVFFLNDIHNSPQFLALKKANDIASDLLSQHFPVQDTVRKAESFLMALDITLRIEERDRLIADLVEISHSDNDDDFKLKQIARRLLNEYSDIRREGVSGKHSVLAFGIKALIDGTAGHLQPTIKNYVAHYVTQSINLITQIKNKTDFWQEQHNPVGIKIIHYELAREDIDNIDKYVNTVNAMKIQSGTKHGFFYGRTLKSPTKGPERTPLTSEFYNAVASGRYSQIDEFNKKIEAPSADIPTYKP